MYRTLPTHNISQHQEDGTTLWPIRQANPPPCGTVLAGDMLSGIGSHGHSVRSHLCLSIRFAVCVCACTLERLPGDRLVHDVQAHAGPKRRDIGGILDGAGPPGGAPARGKFHVRGITRACRARSVFDLLAVGARAVRACPALVRERDCRAQGLFVCLTELAWMTCNEPLLTSAA